MWSNTAFRGERACAPHLVLHLSDDDSTEPENDYEDVIHCSTVATRRIGTR